VQDCAVFCAGRDCGATTQFLGAVDHVPQPVAIATEIQVDASPVVDYLEEQVVVGSNRHVDSGGTRVAGHVGQRLV
jgi:hypothetical protein